LYATDSSVWPDLPDGAVLCDLATRRQWLGRVEIAYALPMDGWLWWPATSDGVVMTCDGVRLTLVDVYEPEQTWIVPMSPVTKHAVHTVWPRWWISPSVVDGDPDAMLVLRWKRLVSVRPVCAAEVARTETLFMSTVRRRAMESADAGTQRLVRRFSGARGPR
jgi:hypothetical protein